MISDAMERILQELYADARARSFELITLEQLLLALMEQSDDVQQVLEALHVDLDVLSGQLVSSIQDNTPTLPPNLMDKVETQPTLGFQRVMQRAIVHAQSVEKREVQPVDVLVALMSEKDCPAVYFLQLQSVSRVEILTEVFMLAQEQAVAIMLLVHHEGKGLCGTYTRDIAQTKQHQVMERAKAEGHPLKCIVEEV